ncbi:hypothetical protein BH09ACT7_BH09ACT7_37580 [soil metagenome]
MPNANYGERPGGHGQGGDSGSVSEAWAERIRALCDPLGPTRTHESPTYRDPDDHSSHAMPAVCEDSEYGCAGMPVNRYKGTIASQTL